MHAFCSIWPQLKHAAARITCDSGTILVVLYGVTVCISCLFFCGFILLFLHRNAPCTGCGWQPSVSGVSVSVYDVGIGIRYFCRYFFYVGSVFGIGILKYRDIGIGIRYFAIIYNLWCNTATTMRVGSFHVHVGL